MAELGRTYSHIVRQPTGRPYQSAGYWGYETTWKEYCLVNMVTKEVVTCGIWIPTDVPKWFGSTEEPDVQFDEWWDSPGNGGVLNATPTQEVDETPKECDQEIQPDCLRPLTAKDRLLVTDALAAYSRPEAEFSDSDALLACTTLFYNLQYALEHDANAPQAEHILWVGATNSHDHGGQGTLASAGTPGKGHVDPKYFIRARASTTGMKELLRQALHEMAHSVGGVTHPNANLLRVSNPNLPMDYSSDPPFSYLHSTSGGNTCIKW